MDADNQITNRGQSPMPSIVRHLGTLVLGVLLPVVLVGVLWRFVEPERLWALLAGIHWGWFGAMVLCFLTYQGLRGERFTKLAVIHGTRFNVTNAMCLHAFLNYMLPAGMGEIGLIVILKRLRVALHVSVASLLVARFVDLLLLYLALVAAFTWRSASLPRELLWIVIAGFAALTTVAAGAAFVLRPRTQRLPSATPLLRFLQMHFGQLLMALRSMLGRRLAGPILALSVAMWGAMYLTFWCSIRSLQVPLGGETILFLYVLLFPINLLPIRSFGNLGIHQGAWFVVLRLLGVDSQSAALLGFGSHVLFLGSASALGMLPFLTYVGTRWGGRVAKRPI